MRTFLTASEGAFSLAAANAKVKMIVVRVAARGLMKDPGRSKHSPRRGFVAHGVAKQPGFQLVGAEDPFDPRSFVEDQRANEVPVARVVEDERPARRGGPAEPVEAHPPVVHRRQAARIFDEEQNVGVASGPVASVARVHPSVWSREVANAKGVTARKGRSDFSGCALEGTDQRRTPVPRLFPGSKSLVARSLVGKRNRSTEVSAIRGADGDRLAARQWLDHARVDPEDRQQREKPNHFKIMIAHGSA